jgi:selenocysteine lyase/cysteine desulfurase
MTGSSGREATITGFDPAPWRMDTPAALGGRIHLNNAGAALMPKPVVGAILDHLRRECEMGGYEAADAAGAEIAAAYEAVASLLGARPRNVAFVENATVAFAQALSAFDFEPGDVIVTTRNDYISNQLMYLSLEQRRGVRLVRADDLPEGGVDPQAVKERIAAERPRLVAVTWVPTNSGLVQPVEEIGAICERAGVPFLVDACQAVGQLPVDVAALRCDFLTATARKFLRGPRGSGFLFAADRVLAAGRYPLWVDMRGATWQDADRFAVAPDATRFENWEFAWALVLGAGEAAAYAARADVAAAGAYAAELAALARERVAAIPGARVLDRGERLCAIATVAFDGHDAGDIVAGLREQAINTSATRRAYAVLDMDEKGADSAVRIAPHYYNTKREIELLASALEEFGR